MIDELRWPSYTADDSRAPPLLYTPAKAWQASPVVRASWQEARVAVAVRAFVSSLSEHVSPEQPCGAQLVSCLLDSSAFFFFFCVRCDDRAKSSDRWLLGSPPSAVVRQLAPRAWCPLQCLLAKAVGVLSPGVGRSEECAQGFAPQSHIHSGLNQQDLVSLDVFLAHSDQTEDGGLGPPVKGVNLVFLRVRSIVS